MATKRIAVLDADSHVFEPAEIWTDYLEREYRVAARSAFYFNHDPDGPGTVILNGRPAPPINSSGLNRRAIWRPAMSPEEIGRIDPSKPCPINPGAQNPAARLNDMDEIGVDKALLFPTLFAEYLPAVENPDIAYALSRAYNNWIDDFCKASPDRLFPVGIVPMQDAAFATEEARRIAARGFKAAFIRPAFANQQNFLSHRMYRPLWRVLEELKLTASIHASTGHTNPEWTSVGAFVERVSARLEIGHSVAEAVAYDADNAIALTALMFCGHTEDYPGLKLAFVHGGAPMLWLALEKAETYLSFYMFDDVTLESAELFASRPYLVTFYPWDAAFISHNNMFQRMGCWGSRYPHHDASAPRETVTELEQSRVPDAVIADLMGANAARV
ncbi:MAG TPA: amidohydrolase family protein, partial [Candidatus Binataceae bacterium]